jgi:hypothetical protein
MFLPFLFHYSFFLFSCYSSKTLSLQNFKPACCPKPTWCLFLLYYISRVIPRFSLNTHFSSTVLPLTSSYISNSPWKQNFIILSPLQASIRLLTFMFICVARPVLTDTWYLRLTLCKTSLITGVLISTCMLWNVTIVGGRNWRQCSLRMFVRFEMRPYVTLYGPQETCCCLRILTPLIR